ncbi:SNF2-related protein [Streptomyces specialis]|uniref:SNF2-related protein n=1 Tax=Streptomyces specialis TaxID=498367 RepID=UPI001F42F96B|nr:SNF2-related protein [Streptomyces specialis]
MDPHVFSRLLEAAWENRHVPAELAAEAAARGGSGRLGIKDLRMLLMRAASLPSAQAAVSGAWAIVSAHPELAASVLHTHCQDIGIPSAFVIREVPGSNPHLFSAQAGWRQPGVNAHGAVVTRPSRKAAHQGAAVSLLGHLCGTEPVEQDSTLSGWVPAGRFSSSSPPAQARDVSFPTRLQEALDRPQIAPAEVAEIVLRINAGELIPRDLHAVLFTARAAAWQPAREAALAAAHDPAVAVALLTLHQSLRYGPPPSYMEEVRKSESGPSLFRMRATCVLDGEEISELGPWRNNKRQARGAAVLRLLAQLADLPVQAPLPVQRNGPRAVTGNGPAQGKNPQEQLKILAESGLISELVYKSAPGITGLEPLFVCVAACVHRGELLTATGRGLGRSSTRLTAAGQLLETVQRAVKAGRGLRLGRIPVPELGGKNPLMLLNELKQTGKISELSIADPAKDSAGFVAQITCKVYAEWLETVGHGPSKRDAQRQAAEAMIELLATPAEGQSCDRGAPTAPEPGTAAATGAVGAHRNPSGPLAGRDEAAAAEDALVELLRRGVDITIDLQDGAGRFLLYRVDGTPLEASCHKPIRCCTAGLVLPGEGIAVGPRPVECWQVPVRLLANALARTSDSDRMAPSVQLWRQAIHLGLAVVADGRVYPTLDSHGADVWRLGPLNEHERNRARQLRQAIGPAAHCGAATDTRPFQLWAPRVAIRAGLDAVAEAILRGPGTSAVLGNTPFANPIPRQQRSTALHQWADRAEDDRAEVPPVDLKLSVHAPKKASPDDTELLWAELLVAQPTAHNHQQQLFQQAAKVAGDEALVGHIRRRLRRIAEVWAPAGRLLECPVPDRFTLLASEAVLLLGATRDELERAGLSVHWPQQWTHLLRTRVVVGAASDSSAAVPRPRFSLDDVLDGRWQMSLGDADLSDQEMDDIGQAPRPLTKVRDQWVMVDEDTARRAADRHIGPISSDRALRASLTGAINIDGQDMPCEPTAALADLVDFLRTGSRTTPVPEPGALQATLRDYQQLGLAWLANTTGAGFGAMLADDMGLGKTLTALALHLHRRETTSTATGATLIVCPASVVINWEREVHRFAPTVPTLRYLGADRTLEDATARTIVITSYETLRRDIDLLALMSFDLAVADEAQMVKNHRTATARALRRIKATVRVALTGTPVENNLTEAWALMDWLNPGLFGTQRVFRDQFARPIEDNIADTERTARLSGLMSAFMLRRRKSDPGILSELPPKDIRPRVVSLTHEQIELYQQTADDTFQAIRDAQGVHRKGLLLELFNKLQQICNSPAQYHKDPLEEEYDPAQAASRSGKIGALDDLLPALTAPNESALIFTRYRTMAKLLLRHLRSHGHDPLYYSGDIPSVRERQRIIDTFQARSGQLMVMTVKAGGTGLTLTQANHVVLFDRPWNPAKESQAIDRAHRLGQQRTVTVHPLITENTLEDRVDELLKHKRALADAVLADGYSALTELTDDQIIDLIALGAQR